MSYAASGTRKAVYCGRHVLHPADHVKIQSKKAILIPTYEGDQADGILGTSLLDALNAAVDFGNDVLISKLK